MQFQSTHPYGCDAGKAGGVRGDAVSIHAPIRVRLRRYCIKIATSRFNPRTHTGATKAERDRKKGEGFQSTHPYGCDECRLSDGFDDPGFNPRTHTGATPNSRQLLSVSTFQSTHPYGCDGMSRMASAVRSGFNPRTHTGATLRPVRPIQIKAFQSTHPYGCDIVQHGLVFRTQFQSTHPYGCDMTDLDKIAIMLVSIHAPIRVRRSTKWHLMDTWMFQSTHPYGCDDPVIFPPKAPPCFNPRTHTGATLKI